ncbi:hypothetical protein DL96DRAFT_1706672 [Flagelloscypha sp. PMI_526]|nr:hypothetical protein DL96DRAFT_1706672 [Flagelloscypha sp. PMI_526]
MATVFSSPCPHAELGSPPIDLKQLSQLYEIPEDHPEDALKHEPKPLPTFPLGSYTISKHDKENLLLQESSRIRAPRELIFGRLTRSSSLSTLSTSRRSSISSINFETGLNDLPPEVLELIAFSCLDWHPSRLDFASNFVSFGYTAFSAGRFTLSAFSQTCKPIRRITERVLYREPQLDFTGWKGAGRKHSRHPGGSLRLLMRTLADRPELAQYIVCAALDYPTSTAPELEDAFEMFIAYATNLKALAMPTWPIDFWEFSGSCLDRIDTIAATYQPGLAEAALESLPALKHLFLRDGPTAVRGLKRDVKHNLKTLVVDSCNVDVTFNLGHCLKIAASSVEELELRFKGSILDRKPLFVRADWRLHASWGEKITKLGLDNLPILMKENLETSFMEFVRALPKLDSIHLSHHGILAPNAFAVLPKNVSLLRLSNYFGVWEDDSKQDEALFMKCLAEAMEMDKGRVKSILCWPGESARFYHQEPIVEFCHNNGVPYVVRSSGEAFIEISLHGTVVNRSP